MVVAKERQEGEIERKTPWLYQGNRHNDKLKTSLKGLRVRRYNPLRLAGLACVRDRETPQEQATSIYFF